LKIVNKQQIQEKLSDLLFAKLTTSLKNNKFSM